ncbi:unnamed protein product [Prorocentrum cordatum]|uniref:Thioester reductase (TE) domain-containing protein n=1 Tax=Prorocentrum cordatum TaxID=2364126 RepID=A0ABN9WQ52_9DINO|nr:unnamed protein product [Polarella glacialis]
MVYGDGRHDQTVAVVDPVRLNTPEHELLKGLHACAAEHGCANHEIVARVIVASKHFSQQEQTLNGTDKLNRSHIFKIYREDLETALDDLARDCVDPTRDLDESMGFRDQGGTSIKANEIANLYGKLGVPRDAVIKLLLLPTGQGELSLQRVKSMLSTASPEKIELPTDVGPGLALSGERGEAVLLTGGTGFLGPFVAAELLRRGRQVICLVRAPNPEAALHRMHARLLSAGLWSDGMAGGLEVVCGSLSADGLGLTQAAADALAARVGYVLHLGAKVDLRSDFAAHRSANVGGTIEVLRLAFRARARVLFASTTDVLVRGAGDEEPDPEELPVPREGDGSEPVGYRLSKLVGELLVKQGQSRGLSALVCRLGMVGGDSRSGACNAQDFLCRLLIGFAHTRAFPEPSGDVPQTFLRFLAADTASEVLVELLFCDETRPCHLTECAEDLPLMDLRGMLERFGKPFDVLTLVPFTEWIGRAEVDGAFSVWPVLSFAKDFIHFPVFNTRSARPGRIKQLVSQNLGARLTSSRQDLETIIHKMLRFLFHSR